MRVYQLRHFSFSWIRTNSHSRTIIILRHLLAQTKHVTDTSKQKTSIILQQLQKQNHNKTLLGILILSLRSSICLNRNQHSSLISRLNLKLDLEEGFWWALRKLTKVKSLIVGGARNLGTPRDGMNLNQTAAPQGMTISWRGSSMAKRTNSKVVQLAINLRSHPEAGCPTERYLRSSYNMQDYKVDIRNWRSIET